MTPVLFTHSTCSPQNAHRAFRQRRDNSIIVFRLMLEIRMETAVSCRGQLDVNCLSPAHAGAEALRLPELLRQLFHFVDGTVRL